MNLEPEERDPVQTVERVIAHLLFWGGLLSIALVLLGLTLYAGTGALRGSDASLAQLLDARQAGRRFDLFALAGSTARGLCCRAIDPLGVIALGLILLPISPVVAVAVAIPAFFWARDYRYAVIAGVVLTILVISFFVGGVG